MAKAVGKFMPSRGASAGALGAFGMGVSAAGGTAGLRTGANSIPVELAFRKQAMTRFAVVADITGSRRGTSDLLYKVFTESIGLFEKLMGNIEIHPIYMSGGAAIPQPAFKTAQEAVRALELTGIKNGSTSYMDVLKVLKAKKRHLEQDYPEDVLVHPGHPDMRAQHSDFDAIIMFPDRFEDKTSGSRAELPVRYNDKAQEFLAGLGEFGVPTFVFHEQTRGRAGYTAQANNGFDSLKRVFVPASTVQTQGSYLSFQDYDHSKILGGTVATAIIMLGRDEETIKYIMEHEPVRGLIESGKFDPKMIEDLRDNNPKLLMPPSHANGGKGPIRT